MFAFDTRYSVLTWFCFVLFCFVLFLLKIESEICCFGIELSRESGCFEYQTVLLFDQRKESFTNLLIFDHCSMKDKH